MVRPWTFHLTAGILCLDFANTLSWRRSTSPVERINNIGDLASWARQSGLLSRKEEASVRRRGAVRPDDRILGQAHRLREAIFEVFAACAEGRTIPARQLDGLSRSIREAIHRSRLVATGGRYRWQVVDGADPIARVLATVALSAEALLRSDDLSRIGECSGSDCRWLWIDGTKNQSRRWCDMAVCGNRAKVHRHYLRSLPS